MQENEPAKDWTLGNGVRQDTQPSGYPNVLMWDVGLISMYFYLESLLSIKQRITNCPWTIVLAEKLTIHH